jgi:hypothetical protein
MCSTRKTISGMPEPVKGRTSSTCALTVETNTGYIVEHEMNTSGNHEIILLIIHSTVSQIIHSRTGQNRPPPRDLTTQKKRKEKEKKIPR